MLLSQMTPRMRADFIDAGIGEEELKQLSSHECFARWLEWNGIIHWNVAIYDAAVACHKAGA